MSVSVCSCFLWHWVFPPTASTLRLFCCVKMVVSCLSTLERDKPMVNFVGCFYGRFVKASDLELKSDITLVLLQSLRLLLFKTFSTSQLICPHHFFFPYWYYVDDKPRKFTSRCACFFFFGNWKCINSLFSHMYYINLWPFDNRNMSHVTVKTLECKVC